MFHMEKAKRLLTELFIDQYGPYSEIRKLNGGGSSRLYYRIFSPGISVVGAYSEDALENKTFINLDRCFEKNGIKVPEIISVSKSYEAYLMEDLGDVSLLECLNSPDRIRLSEKAVTQLAKMHLIPRKEWFNECRYSNFSERLIKWDLNYFKYDFLKPLDIFFDEELLEDDFEKFCSFICNVPKPLQGFMYRDFQSRNIMVKDDDLYFIDFQGGREGSIIYDLVSFLWQAKACFTNDEKELLIAKYIEIISKERAIPKEDIKKWIIPFALFRTLQVLGAYGFRGLIERKTHFIESIPFAVNNLTSIRDSGILEEYSELNKVVSRIISQFSPMKKDDDNRLTVTVESFSFKKGYPEDSSGNGGGFVFDCRAIHNPGRYDAYKSLTGRDKDVIEFLNNVSEANDFIDKAIQMVSPSVEKYISRGFTSLMVGFGCTGGQHRSVFCAEEFSKKLRASFQSVNVRIRIIHREQNIEYYLE